MKKVKYLEEEEEEKTKRRERLTEKKSFSFRTNGAEEEWRRRDGETYDGDYASKADSKHGSEDSEPNSA